jgi:hypothetical protein
MKHKEYEKALQDKIDNPDDYRGGFARTPPYQSNYTTTDYKVTKKGAKRERKSIT